jgi:hypothetical protein
MAQPELPIGQSRVDGFCLATKPFFKIGEVAKLLGVKPHVLRYWESEFPSLKPRKNPSGQRLYAKTDLWHASTFGPQRDAGPAEEEHP